MDREKALREIDRSTAIDPATKAALKAETEKSFAALDAVTVMDRTGSGSGGGRSLAAGFADFATGVFGPVGAYAGLGRGDAQKTLARTSQDQLRETKKQTTKLGEIADRMAGVGTLR